MAKYRIICVGNRYVPGDDVGPRVYDNLCQRQLPVDVEIIDGGLAGLNLLRFVEGAKRVIFVDTLDFGLPILDFRFSAIGNRQSKIQNPIIVLHRDDIVGQTTMPYDHANGLTYLLEVVPVVCEGKVPEIVIVGMARILHEHEVAEIADVCLEIATS
jgi:hydrogenase maturation protease